MSQLTSTEITVDVGKGAGANVGARHEMQTLTSVRDGNFQRRLTRKILRFCLREWGRKAIYQLV